MRASSSTMSNTAPSGAVALERGQEALFVTERCVFRLVQDGGVPGLELCEAAPGIDIDRDIFARMDFMPHVAADLMDMDTRLFAPGPMATR